MQMLEKYLAFTINNKPTIEKIENTDYSPQIGEEIITESVKGIVKNIQTTIYGKHIIQKIYLKTEA